MKNPESLLVGMMAILLSSCSLSDPQVGVELYQKPAHLKPYLTMVTLDTTYVLEEGINSYYPTMLYSFAGDGEMPDEFTAAFISEDPSLEFGIGFTHNKESMNELISTLTQPDQPLSSLGYDDNQIRLESHGFYASILKYNADQQLGYGYNSNRAVQPDESYFKIENAFYGENNSIWLQGTFSVNIDLNGPQPVVGGFLLQFPLCCFD